MERFNVLNWIKNDWRRGRERPLKARLRLALLFLLIAIGIIFAFIIGMNIVRFFIQ